MLDSSVDVLYKCLVCGKAWGKAQSLRAHMKVHRGEGYVGTSIVVKKDLWEWFKEYSRSHNTTTCHLFNALLEMAKKGTDEGVITLGAPNPIQVTINQTFLGRPRSVYKVEVPAPEALLVSGGPEPSRFAEPVAPPGPRYPVWRRRRQVVLGRDPDWLKRQLEI